MAIRALVFDFDGLIVDTETSSFESWREIFIEHGCELTYDVWVDCIGRPGGYFDAPAHLARLTGLSLDPKQLRARRDARFHEMNLGLPMRPGVEAYLLDARRLGLKIGIASSASGARVRRHLDHLGVLNHFHVLKCLEDTTAHKPDPTPYRAVVEALGVAPAEAIAFEDAPHGVASAKGAGLFCVAVPNRVTQRLDFSQADVRVDSLDSLPLEDLLSRFGLSPAVLDTEI